MDTESNNSESGTVSEPAGEDRSGREWIGYALIAAALIILIFSFATADPGVVGPTSGDLTLRVAQMTQMPGEPPTPRYREFLTVAHNEYREAYEQEPSPALIRRIALVSAELKQPAMPVFEQLTSPEIIEVMEQAERDALQEELAMWRDIYGIVQVAPDDVSEYERRIEALDLGPTRIYAIRQLYVAAGQPDQAQAAYQQALMRTLTRMAPVMAVWALLFIIGIPVLANFVRNRRRYFERIDEEPEGRMPSPRTLWSSFVVFLILFVLLQSVAAIVAVEQPVSYQVVALFGSYVLAGLLGLIWLSGKMRRENSDVTAIGFTTKNAGKNLLTGIAGYAALLPIVFVTLILIQIVERLFPGLPSPTHPAGPLIAEVAGQPVIILLFVLVAVMAPIFEEIFFRGALYYGLRVRFSVVAAVLLSGAVFAAVHPQLPLGFLPLFVLGAGFAVMLAITKSLIPAMVAHSINNILSFFLALFLLAD